MKGEGANRPPHFLYSSVFINPYVFTPHSTKLLAGPVTFLFSVLAILQVFKNTGRAHETYENLLKIFILNGRAHETYESNVSQTNPDSHDSKGDPRGYQMMFNFDGRAYETYEN